MTGMFHLGINSLASETSQTVQSDSLRMASSLCIDLSYLVLLPLNLLRLRKQG